MNYPCVIPTVTEDYIRMRHQFFRFFAHLPINKMIFIGPDSLKPVIEKDIAEGLFDAGQLEFIPEKTILDIKEVKPIYDELLKNSTTDCPSSVNWYYQQFLKMGYALICPEEYYLCWDSDTVPLKDISMFSEDGRPYLDVKTEFQNSYFATIYKLFKSGKIIEKSFISEHMLFKKDLMLEMINEIENVADISGTRFYEKIMNAVGSDNIKTGFSEFETYGTWLGLRHPSDYKLRNWMSFRNANFFVDISNLDDEDVAWLSKDYDAATFEKYQPEQEEFKELFRSPRYREKLTPKQFYTSVLESGILGDYVNGMIKIGNQYFPV